MNTAIQTNQQESKPTFNEYNHHVGEKVIVLEDENYPIICTIMACKKTYDVKTNETSKYYVLTTVYGGYFTLIENEVDELVKEAEQLLIDPIPF